MNLLRMPKKACTYSFGPRNCLGRNLAHMGMRVAMIRLLWGVDVELVDKENRFDKQSVRMIW